MKVLTIIKANLMQLGIQSLAVGPICCVSGHHQAAMNLSQCYQMVGRIEKKRTSSTSKRRSIAATITTNNTPHNQNHNQKPLKNKRLVNRRVRFNLDESKSSKSMLLVKDSTTPISAMTTNTDSGFHKNKQKCRKSSASIVIVSVFEISCFFCLFLFLLCVCLFIHAFSSCCILQNKNYNINLSLLICEKSLSIISIVIIL